MSFNEYQEMEIFYMNMREHDRRKIASLEERINKAKEYLEKFIPIDIDTIILSERQRDYLLEILGDK